VPHRTDKLHIWGIIWVVWRELKLRLEVASLRTSS